MIDLKIQESLKDLAQKTIEKQSSNIFVKLLLTALVAVGMFFLVRKMNDQAYALATMKAQAALDQLTAERALAQTQADAMMTGRADAERSAAIHLSTVRAVQAQIDENLAKHDAQMEALAALKQGDWAALNAFIGVPP